MDKTVQKKEREKPVLSPLAKDKTYGEKVYDRIFNTGLNFWLNLIASGAFTFWVTHSTKPLWKPKTFMGGEFRNLGELHKVAVEKIAESGLLKSLKTPELRKARASAIVNVFTLQIPGHAIVIPSVTLGARFKGAIVRHFNKKHYGDEAMESPDLIARHHAIDVEERPTVLGAVVGRLGGMIINMGLGGLIGSEKNLVNKIGDKTNLGGLKRFSGIDPVAGKIGEHIGEVAAEMAPKSINKANSWFANNGYTAGVNELGRFMAQDVMYTISTSSTIYPVVKFMRKILPGMTYKPKTVTDPAFDNLPRIAVPQNPLTHADDKAAMPPPAEIERNHDSSAHLHAKGAHQDTHETHETPHAKISGAHHHETIGKSHEHAVATAG